MHPVARVPIKHFLQTSVSNNKFSIYPSYKRQTTASLSQLRISWPIVTNACVFTVGVCILLRMYQLSSRHLRSQQILVRVYYIVSYHLKMATEQDRNM
jgi:hypothetical protein